MNRATSIITGASASPSKEEVAQARADVRLTQAEAAAVIYMHMNAWARYERGITAMPRATWELFLIKTKRERAKVK